MEHTDVVLQRIQLIRKRKQRNIHDCAAFLNISKKDYLKFEQDAEMLSLPEVELLAFYFGVSPSAFFEPNPQENDWLALLDDQVKPQYLNFRHKMIQAKIASAFQKKAIRLDEIHEQTSIPVEVLEQYTSGEEPIPLDHLLEISRVLGFDVNDLVAAEWSDHQDINLEPPKNRWQPEFSSDHSPDEAQEGDAYLQLLSALKALPTHDRAEVAKLLLTKLKSIKNG